MSIWQTNCGRAVSGFVDNLPLCRAVRVRRDRLREWFWDEYRIYVTRFFGCLVVERDIECSMTESLCEDGAIRHIEDVGEIQLFDDIDSALVAAGEAVRWGLI